MALDFHGRLVDRPEIKAGFIGCGSHAQRNVLPALQFAPVRLDAVCDLDLERARAAARRFGAPNAYTDYREMIAREHLDAVFIVTGYDERGRPRYPALARGCLEAGVHVFIEKPPAASAQEILQLQAAARTADKTVVVGFKKMFFPVNQKARELIDSELGPVTLACLQYPLYVPTAEEFRDYVDGGKPNAVVGFLDHICHPVSALLALFGSPISLYYERSTAGAGTALFRMPSGALVTLLMTHAACRNGGMERTLVVSSAGRHLVIDNNIRLTLHRDPPSPSGQGYGSQPSFFEGSPGETSATWEPEFSLGQLYNKGLFLLGYWGEVNEFACAILERRAPRAGSLDDALVATRIFEAFAQGPGKSVSLASD